MGLSYIGVLYEFTERIWRNIHLSKIKHQLHIKDSMQVYLNEAPELLELQEYGTLKRQLHYHEAHHNSWVWMKTSMPGTICTAFKEITERNPLPATDSCFCNLEGFLTLVTSKVLWMGRLISLSHLPPVVTQRGSLHNKLNCTWYKYSSHITSSFV